MKFLLFTFLVFSPFLFLSQGSKLELKHPNALVFFDYIDQSFYALDDSTFIWRFDQQKNSWQKATIELNLEIPFEEFLKDFIPLSDKDCPTYFVHSGCGVVYQKLKYKIYRHDKSFKHMNQFGGSFFMDEGEPRIFGGYGLFTLKNIITRYDTVSREWYELPVKGKRPLPMYLSYLIKSKNSYHILGGLCENKDQSSKNTKIWCYNKLSRKWNEKGSLKAILNDDHLAILINETSPRIASNLICTSKYLFEFKPEKKSIFYHQWISEGKYDRIIIGQNQIGLLSYNGSKNRFLITITSNTFLDSLTFKGFHLQNDFQNFASKDYLFFIFLLPILTLVAYFRNRIFAYMLKPNFKQNSVNLDVRDNYSNGYTNQEIMLINVFIEKRFLGIEISDINDLVNQNNPSIDTLKKRRELLLKELRFKLSNQFNISINAVFTEKRMEKDKRMKLLFLNEAIIEELRNLILKE